MRYVALIYQGSAPLPGSVEWEARSEEEQQQIYADYGAVTATPGVEGGLPMGTPDMATTVRVENGRPLVTDGPYVSTKEAVGGYIIIEAEDLDAAIAVAARIPAARLGGGVEIRPEAKYW
jgi:hypothetical protein